MSESLIVMPIVIYILSLCTFAFGLSEFVLAGLVSTMAVDLDASIAAVGTSIAVYALGATIGAPLITAWIAHWKDKQILMLAMAVLAIGSVLMSLAPHLSLLLAVRFLVGLGHGVLMAVASDVATRRVNPQYAGRALAVVWIGLTLALAIGVPLGTFLGSLWTWRGIFLSIAGLALLSMLGLQLFMANPVQAQTTTRTGAIESIKAIMHPQLLTTAAIAVLVSMATFCFFTFVSPYLLQITELSVQGLALAMLLFGVCSIAGNLLGGRLADSSYAHHATVLALLGLGLNLIGLYLLNASALMMMVLVAVLGVFFFLIVTLLTLRLLQQAQRFRSEATAVAAGLNIASFNLGTALGGALGAITIAYGSLNVVPLVGALAAVLAVILLLLQKKQISIVQQ